METKTLNCLVNNSLTLHTLNPRSCHGTGYSQRLQEAYLGDSWKARACIRVLDLQCCQIQIKVVLSGARKAQITLSRIFNQDERTLLLCRWKQVFIWCFFNIIFFCCFYCYSVSAVPSQQPANYSDPDPEVRDHELCCYQWGLTWPQRPINTTPPINTCNTRPKLWIFLSLAQRAPRRWRQEVYLFLLGWGG